mmetsp:Transcript_47391/g.148184  ORF Transcript_47391/g.148184 Transcript_47391/m.148184 type:complete len:137 (+) Transcript_47391:962-1372(+)
MSRRPKPRVECSKHGSQGAAVLRQRLEQLQQRGFMFMCMTTCPCGVTDSAAAAADRRLPLLRRRLVAHFHRDLKQVRRVHLLRRLLEFRPLREQIVHPVHACLRILPQNTPASGMPNAASGVNAGPHSAPCSALRE